MDIVFGLLPVLILSLKVINIVPHSLEAKTSTKLICSAVSYAFKRELLWL